MGTRIPRERALAAIGALALAMSPAGAAAQTCTGDQATARIVATQGQVTAIVQDADPSTARRLTRGIELAAGSVVTIGPRSGGSLMLCATGAILRLDQRSSLVLRAVDGLRGAVELLRGAIYFFSNRPQSLTVHTPYVDAGIEGTEFVLRVADGGARLTVVEGTVLARNEHGRTVLVSGEGLAARAGGAPGPAEAMSARDAVAWAVHYEPLVFAALGGTLPPAVADAIQAYAGGDLERAFARLDDVPVASRGPRYRAVHGALLLAVGQVDDARRAFAAATPDALAAALDLTVELTRAPGRAAREAVLADANALVGRAPDSAPARLAQSYVRQSLFDLPGALASVHAALRIAPDNVLARARLAELHLSVGDRRAALTEAERANAAGVALARTHIVLGFARLLDFDAAGARAAFERAITLDQTDPLPRTGLAIALIRDGQLEHARLMLETAVAQSPLDPLPRSYLGKLYTEQGEGMLAAQELDTAAEFGPLDPTPWLYLALLAQSENRPVAALAALRQSIARNDNRAVYRSRLLLDSDRAARGTALARIHDDLGFAPLGVQAAARSLAYDPASPAAHRFLADAYAGQPRHEIARVSELLRSQLLAQPNLDPVQPHLSVADLNVTAARGAPIAGPGEFTALFERDRARVDAAGMAGNHGTWGEEVVVSALYGPVALSAGQLRSRTDGFRTNNDVDNDLASLFAQVAITPELSVQGEVRRRRTEQGDLALNFGVDDFFANERRDIDRDTVRFGARFSPRPDTTLIASLFHVDETLRTSDSDFFGDIASAASSDGYQAEAQYIRRGEGVDIVAGAGRYDIDVDETVSGTVFGFPFAAAFAFERKQSNVYTYASVRSMPGQVWTFGLAYDHFTSEALDVREVSPKLGVRFELNDRITLRAAAFATVKRALIADQTIEPTEIAGFNQFFDDINGSRTRRYGVGVDIAVSPEVALTLAASARHVDIPGTILDPFGAPTTVFLDTREDHVGAFLGWTPAPGWSASAALRYDSFRPAGSPDFGFPSRVRTVSIPLEVRHFSPSGLFASLGATWVDQAVSRPPGALFEAGADTFLLVDAAAGYRFARGRGSVSVEVRNLTDQSFRFQDDNFRTSEVRSTPYVPTRLFLVRARLRF